MSFHIGQKVVCVDDEWDSKDGEIEPVMNHVYTVRDLGDGDEEFPCIRLVEIVNPPVFYTCDGMAECSWADDQFRPLEEKPDSIELFREIARGVSNGKPIIEDAEYRPRPVPITTPAGPLVIITGEGWFYP